MGSAYWDNRAGNYNKLSWVGKKESIEKLVSFLSPEPNDILLDMGCGTGKILTAIAPYVQNAYGCDLSQKMLEQVPTSPNMSLIQGDGLFLPFRPNSLTKVVVRMVLHDVLSTQDREMIVSNVYDVLQPEGTFLIGEGVPPNREVLPYLAEIFKHKEDRIWFFPEDLEELLRKNHFKQVESLVYVDKDFDVKNWLENDGTLSEEKREKILGMYRNAPEYYKRVHNLRDDGKKILIDPPFALVKGRK